jgi:predicted alternative tryptophan synthase beta-subunit
MVRATLRQKPIRGDMMRLFGAVVHESPSPSFRASSILMA